MDTLATDVPPNTRAHEAYKKFMTGLRGDDAKRTRRYISQTARATDPLPGETLGTYLGRVGKIVKERFEGPKSISVEKPKVVSPPVIKKQKRSADPMRSMSAEKPKSKVRAKAPSPNVDPLDDVMKLFSSMNMTKTTKKNAIASRPVLKTSRQTAVAAAKAEEKAKRTAESLRLKELADKKRELRKERKKTKTEADTLADLFTFKLGGKNTKKH